MRTTSLHEKKMTFPIHMHPPKPAPSYCQHLNWRRHKWMALPVLVMSINLRVYVIHVFRCFVLGLLLIVELAITNSVVCENV